MSEKTHFILNVGKIWAVPVGIQYTAFFHSFSNFQITKFDFDLEYFTSVSKMTTYRLEDQDSFPGRNRISLH
jgi:hypothetical protein